MTYIKDFAWPKYGEGAIQDTFDKATATKGILRQIYDQLNATMDGRHLAPNCGIDDGMFSGIHAAVTHSHKEPLSFQDGSIPVEIFDTRSSDSYIDFVFSASTGVQFVAGWGPWLQGATIDKEYYVPFGIQAWVEDTVDANTFYSPFILGARPTVVCGLAHYGQNDPPDIPAIFSAVITGVTSYGFSVYVRASNLLAVGGAQGFPRGYHLVYMAMATTGSRGVGSQSVAVESGRGQDWSPVIISYGGSRVPDKPGGERFIP